MLWGLRKHKSRKKYKYKKSGNAHGKIINYRKCNFLKANQIESDYTKTIHTVEKQENFR